MSGWVYYFLAKVCLHLRGHIPLDVVANFAFAVWLILPIPAPWAKLRAVVWGRRLLDAAAAVVLAWHDSWLPPVSSAVAFLRDNPLPSADFLAQLVWRNVATAEVALLVAIIAVAATVRRRVRLTPIVLGLLALVAVRAYGGSPEAADRLLASFYASEAKQTTTFSGQQGQPFDVVLLHVCSLSWDDLAVVGLDRDPFLRRFDLLFTRFNSVTTHSNPSAIRLLRSACGQSPHGALYQPTREECYLSDQWAAGGYRSYTALNHDGSYGGMVEEIMRLGHAAPPLGRADAPMTQVDFTGKPVYDDYGVLANWWRRRRTDTSARAMLYYNTITLHDGGRRAGDGGSSGRDRPAQYAAFVRTLFEDFERFFALMEADGRRVAVVMVAEHGVALRGSRVQPAGLREVPLPSITMVPVGVKLIGPGWFRGDRDSQVVVARPTSYLAIASVLAQLGTRSMPGLDPGDLARLADQIPSTDYVAENQGAIVVRDGERYLAKGRSFGMHWVELPLDAVGANRVPPTAR
jgi:cellulose synthase operon protein YhjU